jgi:predicted TIM-barrel fold metal-dependent hydrolase
VLCANNFERIGLPSFCDEYWDPIYAAAQELDLPVNFHIGFSSEDLASALLEDTLAVKRADTDRARKMARTSTALLLNQGDLIGSIVTSGVCDRFPRLNFVSVETGFGYIPFYLEALDWHWRAYGNKSDLLPSEYFKRQCYGTLWFERTTLALLDEFADNFMFSTDYPHGTSLSPGPASPAEVPSRHIATAYAGVNPEVARKVISGNACRLYKLPPAKARPAK